jgi:hypothetical protein
MCCAFFFYLYLLHLVFQVSFILATRYIKCYISHGISDKHHFESTP